MIARNSSTSTAYPLLGVLGFLVGWGALFAASVEPLPRARAILLVVALVLAAVGVWVGLTLPGTMPPGLGFYGGGSLLLLGGVMVWSGGVLPPLLVVGVGPCWSIGAAVLSQAIKTAWPNRGAPAGPRD